MKTVVILMLVNLSIYAVDDLDGAHRFQRAVDAIEFEKDMDKAKLILEDVLSDIDSNSPIFRDVYRSYLRVSGVKKSDSLEKAIKFATGKRSEFYCKDKGLVSSVIHHNDNTTSRLMLVEDNRKLKKGSYSIVLDGSWKFQLSTGYREPVVSKAWINSASENHYDIQEIRVRENGEDRGQWTAKWEGDSMTNNYSTQGSVKEPIPMYMATDYQAFGTSDQGYRINFQVGSTSQHRSKESTFNNGRIRLIAHRTVLKHFKNLDITLLKEGRRTFKDCYEVETVIKFNGLEKK